MNNCAKGKAKLSNKALMALFDQPERTFYYHKREHMEEIAKETRFYIKYELTVELFVAMVQRWITAANSGKAIDAKELDGIFALLGIDAKTSGGGEGAGDNKGEIIINASEMTDDEIEIKVNRRLQDTRQANTKKST
jgi:hypothetical protein